MISDFIQKIGLFALAVTGSAIGCSDLKNPVEPPDTIGTPVWITNPSKTALLWKTNAETATDWTGLPTIKLDPGTRFQSVEGFGYTLTGGSAQLLYQMDAEPRRQLLQELFGNSESGIQISYLRISLGASDLSASVYTYNDLPTGQTDELLQQFSLDRDTQALIPILKEILQINPSIPIMASPWTAPLWMKSNQQSVGGYLLPAYYSVYAQYFVKYIQAMKNHGIPIQAVTPQNEPDHGGNNPSMVMTASQQADFIKNHLGPAFQSAGLDVKIIIWDHNCDQPEFPLQILADPQAKAMVDGTAFHLYAGDISALSQVHQAHPDKNVYFTEQWTSSTGDFGQDLKWHIKQVMIGSMRNWSKIALEWNLANDPQFKPHTPGGCSQCKGALTIDGNQVERNVSYYIIAAFSKFVPPGSIRIESNLLTQLPNVAFETPQGNLVVIVLNESAKTEKFAIQTAEKTIGTSLSPGSVGTFVF